VQRAGYPVADRAHGAVLRSAGHRADGRSECEALIQEKGCRACLGATTRHEKKRISSPCANESPPKTADRGRRSSPIRLMSSMLRGT